MLPFDDEADRLTKAVEVLWSVDGWPRDQVKDLAFVRQLEDAFGGNVYEEAVAWAAWMSEHEQKKQIKYRSRFRNWCFVAREFRERNAAKMARHRGPEDEGHGDDVSATRGW